MRPQRAGDADKLPPLLLDFRMSLLDAYLNFAAFEFLPISAILAISGATACKWLSTKFKALYE